MLALESDLLILKRVLPDWNIREESSGMASLRYRRARVPNLESLSSR